MLGGKRQLPDRVLAGENALLRPLQTMVKTVAHQMIGRIDDALDQAFVQLGFLANRDQLHLLAELAPNQQDRPGGACRTPFPG